MLVTYKANQRVRILKSHSAIKEVCLMEAKNSAFYIVRYDAPITKCEMVM